ncbi:segregation and condensation protein B [Mycoplasma sp. CAG:956]|nr:segregation and condensation protein B [Mycoplasma sp. CAG:956]
MNKQGILEGLLFVVGDDGLTLKQISELLDEDIDTCKEILLSLKQSYEAENRGIRISYLGDAFKLTTKKEHKDYYQKLIVNPNTNTLSQAALETLAIIAYNQPITRIEIDELRGVNNTWLLRKLVAKGLIKEVGKSTMPGRPNLYGTTSDFLDYFGLSTIKDLPKIEPKKEEKITGDLFNSIYKEEVKDESN